MDTKIILRCLVFCCILLASISCKKYLDEKSNLRLALPETLEDLQSILDNTNFINRAIYGAVLSADEYYLLPNNFNALNNADIRKQLYTWEPDAQDKDDWNRTYNQVFYANVVLDNVEKISPHGQQATWDAIKGAGLFVRAYSFFQVAQLYAPPYNASSAATDLGIVLRPNSDFNIRSTRSTVQETYDQIINDLEEAAGLLPEEIIYRNRPSKAAAYAMLARVHLSKRDYAKAKDAANSCLAIYNVLSNYDNLTVSKPFEAFKNPEVLFYTNSATYWSYLSSTARADTSLYKLFDANDWRKTFFYKTNGTYRFSYNNTGVFDGLATDEVILVRAECYAREGNVEKAMEDLNWLLVNRMKTGFHTDLVAADQDEALSFILTERRKELVLRGTRWSDLRRLNTGGENIIIRRMINGEDVPLASNDKRYVLLIPQAVIEQAGVEQNER